MKAQAAAIALAALALAGLTGCVSPPAYVPAARIGEVGYAESRIERARFRIVYQGPTGVGEAQAMEFALRRAAELAMQEGYEWFITDNQRFAPTPATPAAAPQPRQDPFGSRRSLRSRGGFGAGAGGFGAPAALPPRTTGARVDLLVRLGRGPKPELPGVYMASEVKARFMPM